MMILSLRSKTSREIARQLDFCTYLENRRLVDNRSEPENILIRWGSTKKIPFSVNHEINTIQAIKKASDKLVCRRLLESAGIPTPLNTESEFPCVGRRRKHSGGKGFFLCHSKEDIERAKKKGAVYFSQFYPKQDEYRVHIGHNRVILFSIKVGDKSKYVWNKRRNGFTFRHIRRREWRNNEALMDLVRLAKRAIKVVGLDFGGVDILTNPKDNNLPKAVVCEINTTPGGSPLTIQKYVQYFNKIKKRFDNS